MYRRMSWIIVFAVAAGTLVGGTAQAQLNLFRKAEPAEGLELKAEHGPWLIMCASFVNEAGEAQAQALVEELRNSYKLDAYLYRKQFDYSDKIVMTGWEAPVDQQSAPVAKQGVPAHPATFEEIAVVVGHFPDIDDRQAQRTLQLIKTIRPDSLRMDENTQTFQRMGAFRAIQRSWSGDAEAHEKGPMGSAFLMPNPWLPDDFFDRPKMDPLIVDLNKDVEYSLFDCPGNYSVKIATFKGEQLFSESQILKKQREYQDQLESGKPVTQSKLAEAGVKAHVLCKLLRRKGIEAWEFHDHHESYVCVGNFDWAMRETAGGVETNSEIARVIQQYKAREVNVNGMRQLMPRTIRALNGLDIYFDAQPLPIAVPKLHSERKRGIFGR